MNTCDRMSFPSHTDIKCSHFDRPLAPAASQSFSSDLLRPVIRRQMDVMEALRWMRWELESYAAYGDFVALPFFVMLFLDRFLLETLAMQLIPRKVHGNFSTENERRRKINKFKESAWKSVYFLSGESLFLPVTYSEPWFTKYQILMDRTRRSGLARSENKAVYTYAATFYASSIFALCSGKQDNPISMCQCLII